eukprot:scaffold281921_cov13-Tisochrysis_lutea.AAC.1
MQRQPKQQTSEGGDAMQVEGAPDPHHVAHAGPRRLPSLAPGSPPGSACTACRTPRASTLPAAQHMGVV